MAGVEGPVGAIDSPGPRGVAWRRQGAPAGGATMLARVTSGRRRGTPLALAAALAVSLAGPGAGPASAQSAAATVKELQDAMGASKSAPKADPAFTVVCRSLRKTTLYYSYDAPPNPYQVLPQGYLLIEFDRGSGPVGVGGSKLKPGECAWRDRRFKADEPARILVPYVAFKVETGLGDPATAPRLEVLYRGLWKSMAALAHEDFLTSFPVHRAGQNFVVPDPITKMEAPTKAR